MLKGKSQQMTPPPWEVLDLVAHQLDPKTLANASCVSKSWHVLMSSDHIWQPICAQHFASLTNLKIEHPSVSYRQLYAMAYVSSKRRAKTIIKPRLSLDDIQFAINIISTKDDHSDNDGSIVSLVKTGSELLVNGKCNNFDGPFKFDIGVDNNNHMLFQDMHVEEVQVTWTLVLRGFRAIFTMMDCPGKIKLAPAPEGWFSEELPTPGCCTSNDVTSGIVADMKLGFCNGGIGDVNGKEVIRVDKVRVGILSIVYWRYVSVDDGLRYLQHFLVPL